MNILVQAALGALLAAGGVTAAVTTARPATPTQITRWVPSVIVGGVGEDDVPYLASEPYRFPTKYICDSWLNSDIAKKLHAGFWLNKALEHQGDDTFTLADPVCVQREMDPPGTPA